MGGSRKGEQRGGARPGKIRKSRSNNPAGRSVGTKRKSPHDPALIALINRDVTPLTREKDLELYFAVTGKRLRMPKEVMLDVMRYFEEMAIEYGEVVRANMKLAASAKTPEQREVYENALITSEHRMREYLIMAKDAARDAGQYFHPKLSAIATAPNINDGLSALSVLMKDLDEAGRPARYIDHDANEVVK